MAEMIKGFLVSNLDHPVYLSYNGEALTLSPRARIKNVNKKLLGALPKGVFFVEEK